MDVFNPKLCVVLGNKFCLKKRSRLIKVLDNRLQVKFMKLEIGLLTDSLHIMFMAFMPPISSSSTCNQSIEGFHCMYFISLHHNIAQNATFLFFGPSEIAVFV